MSAKAKKFGPCRLVAQLGELRKSEELSRQELSEKLEGMCSAVLAELNVVLICDHMHPFSKLVGARWATATDKPASGAITKGPCTLMTGLVRENKVHCLPRGTPPPFHYAHNDTALPCTGSG